MTQTQLAEMLGMKTYTTITKWEKDENFPKGKDIKRLSEIFNVSSDYILGIDRIPNVERVNKTVSIPILGTIACGEPINAEENIEGYKERIADDLPPGELFYLKAKGDSMTPVINSGSLVLCRRQDDVENGEIAAVLVNGDEEATLKRVRKVSGMIILEPLNEEYEPYIINEKNPARIVGKALEVVSTL